MEYSRWGRLVNFRQITKTAQARLPQLKLHGSQMTKPQ